MRSLNPASQDVSYQLGINFIRMGNTLSAWHKRFKVQPYLFQHFQVTVYAIWKRFQFVTVCAMLQFLDGPWYFVHPWSRCKNFILCLHVNTYSTAGGNDGEHILHGAFFFISAITMMGHTQAHMSDINTHIYHRQYCTDTRAQQVTHVRHKHTHVL